MSPTTRQTFRSPRRSYNWDSQKLISFHKPVFSAHTHNACVKVIHPSWIETKVYNTTLADASSHKTGCTFDIFTMQVNVWNYIPLGISSLASLKRDDRLHSVYSTFQLRYRNICEPLPSIGSLVLDDLKVHRHLHLALRRIIVCVLVCKNHPDVWRTGPFKILA